MPEKIWAVQGNGVLHRDITATHIENNLYAATPYTRSDLVAALTAERDRLREALENVLNARASECPDVKLHNKICEDAWELLDGPRKALEGREE